MQFGTIALIDALGFRGIWNERRGGPEKARNMLRSVKAALEKERTWAADHWKDLGEHAPASAKSMRFSAHFMSDTAAIAAAAELPDGWRNDPDPHAWARTLSTATMYVVLRALAPAIRAAAFSDLPVSYRGAIACGEMDVDSDFTVGPAVDDAAAEMETADGALVWLLPSAISLCQHMRPHDWAHVWERTVDFSVPRNGQPFRTRAVNPFIVQEDPQAIEAERLEAAILGSFASASVDVAVKRQNTADFLTRARHWVSTPSLALQSSKAELVATLRDHGMLRTGEAWSEAERLARVRADLPVTSRFPGTEADAVALVQAADSDVEAKGLWKKAYTNWLEHPPAVPGAAR